MEADDKKKFNLEFNNLLILYRHYKDYLLPFGIIVACALVVLWVVIPQFQQYLSLQQQLKTEMQKLNVLKNNYNFLSSLDDSKSNADFNALTLVLPSGKDFAGIINAVSYASEKTGVAVGDFSFSVGSLSGGNTEGVSAYPSIKIDINLIGNTQAVANFIQELYKTAPVSEVTSIKTGGNSGTITILFYYKPFPQQNVDDSAPVTVLSAQDAVLIKTVSGWNNSLNQPQLPLIPSLSAQGSTSSASPSNGSSPF
jgi:Tfp pilus assembly protein PilO